MQEQIRRRVIEAIYAEVFPAGSRLPSSRRLSKELGVSRNTVFLAYQQLISEGHLETRERSGLYVPETAAVRRLASPALPGGAVATDGADVVSRFLEPGLASDSAYKCPPDWQKYRYPFIEGRYDRSLFPVTEWREASRLALAVSEVEDWSLDNGEVDDTALIEEIRTKLLPRRGITARPDELLITVGEQQALFLALQVLVGKKSQVAVEEPGLPELRSLLALRRANVHHQPVDDSGIIVDERLGGRDLVCVSASRQRPTGVTLSLERRHALMAMAERDDFLVLEDDFECEMNYLGDAVPALRSLENGQRVVYVASLSKVLAPGVRLGYMVAAPEIIAAARRLRDLTTRRPSPNNQRAAAFFLSLGHYDAMMRRLTQVCAERLIALRDALNHYRPLAIAVAPVEGGTSYWVRGPDGLDASEVIRAAEARGILIEPADHWFADDNGPGNMFRLGVTSLPASSIRDGIAELSRAMRDIDDRKTGRGEPTALEGKALLSRLSGATLLYKTVYGDPCTIELHADGRMSGQAGFAGEDRDVGRWWVDGGQWYRQWRNWAFGEVLGFAVAFEGDQLHWLDRKGHVVDSAVLAQANEGAGS
ncbi:PLP-dependent aminotransferase family protein [Maricaulis sp.]|uniref:aminotransferase-like domain-containing protein n=1 Tax=Maricaulis sp. TaxID=1486257 RepID=UPI003A93FC53